MKSDKWFDTTAVLAFAFGVWTMGICLPAAAAPSSYHKTCRNISIERNVLSALCKKGNGSELRTSISLRGIENIDGTLRVRDPNKSANFYLTCIDTRVYDKLLTSVCKKGNGQYQSTRISINGIANLDGVLNYTSDPM